MLFDSDKNMSVDNEDIELIKLSKRRRLLISDSDDDDGDSEGKKVQRMNKRQRSDHLSSADMKKKIILDGDDDDGDGDGDTMSNKKKDTQEDDLDAMLAHAEAEAGLEDLFSQDDMEENADDRKFNKRNVLHNDDDDDDDPYENNSDNALVPDDDKPPDAIKKAPKHRQKFDEKKLVGTKGTKVLMSSFGKGLHFHGKGHEAHDLQQLMKAYEIWAHTLFTSMSFTDIINRIEKLGKKPVVKLFLRAMREGKVPDLPPDFVDPDDPAYLLKQTEIAEELPSEEKQQDNVKEYDGDFFDNYTDVTNSTVPGAMGIINDDIYGSSLTTSSSISNELAESSLLRAQRNRERAIRIREQRKSQSISNITGDVGR